MNTSLDRLKQEAKALLRAYRADEPDALETIRQAHPRYRERANDVLRAANFHLGEMQHVVASRCGFSTWTELKRAVEAAATIDWSNPTSDSLRDFFVRAVTQGETDEVERLLRHGHVRDNLDAAWFPTGMAALQRAVASAADMVDGEHRSVVDTLLDAGADIDARADYGATPLQIVSRKFSYFADEALAGHLLDRGATLDVHSAVGLGLAGLVRGRISADLATVHLTTRHGLTPLHYAHTVEMADVLLDHGANIDARDTHRDSTPAQWALFHSHREQRDWRELAQHYVDREADADFLLLCALDDRERVEARLSADPDIANCGIDLSQSPHAYQLAKMCWWRESYADGIQAAVNYDRHDLLSRLINAGGQFTLQHWDALVPKGHRALDTWLTALVRSRVDLNAAATGDGERVTPLMHVARSEGLQTPENLARELAGSLRALLRRGADPHVTDARGRTALHHAAANPYGGEGIAVLLAHDAERHARDNAGETPRSRAEAEGMAGNVAALRASPKAN